MITMSTIKDIRTENGIMQPELATKARVSVGTISALENGRYVSRKSIKMICDALGVSMKDVDGLPPVRKRTK